MCSLDYFKWFKYLSDFKHDKYEVCDINPDGQYHYCKTLSRSLHFRQEIFRQCKEFANVDMELMYLAFSPPLSSSVRNQNVTDEK